MPSFLNPLEWMTHIGQIYQTSGFDVYGNTTVTSVQTVSCLVFQHGYEGLYGVPVSTDAYRDFFMIVSNTVATSVGDKISAVYDPYDNVVIDEALVKQVFNYNMWDEKPEFRLLQLGVVKDA